MCVVGGGAAGLAVGVLLDGTAVTVAVLEAGGDARDPIAEREAFRVAHSGVPYSNPYPTRARVLGGSTLLWFGRIAVLDRIDLQRRAWVPSSGWPIDHAELMRWVPAAADLLAVDGPERLGTGSADGISSAPADVPTWIESTGLRVEPFIWSERIDMAEHHGDTLRRSTNVTVITDATACGIGLDRDRTAAESVQVAGPEGVTTSVRARAVVLAAGGLENPRLLLSTARDHRHAIGNAHDLVGRYYMDHPRSEASATIDLAAVDPARVTELVRFGEHRGEDGRRLQLRFAFTEERQRHEHLLNHCIHADLSAPIHDLAGLDALRQLFERLPRGRDRSKPAPLGPRPTIAQLVRPVVSDAGPLIAHGLRRIRGAVVPTLMHIHDQMEQVPEHASRLTVDWADLDRWGLPRPHIHWTVDDATFRSRRRMHELLRDAFADAGIDSFHSAVLDPEVEDPGIMEMKHPSGATRMGSSRSDSVVDRDLRLHDVANMYVVGSSTFPTVGHANPTLTIVALAARLCDHLIRELTSPVRISR